MMSGWKVRGSVGGSDSSLHEGKRWRERGGVRRGLWSMIPEHLHAETGK